MPEPESDLPDSAWRAAFNAAFGAPFAIKLAADGMWEGAYTAPLHTSEYQDSLERWLAEAGPDVAIEVVFATKAFIGARLRTPERPYAFELARRVFDHLTDGLGADHRSTSSAASVLDMLDHTIQIRFDGGRPRHAELGVLDRWLTRGPIRLGPPPWPEPEGDDALPDHRLSPLLREAALPTPLMLEVAYGPLGDGWLAMPVPRRARAVGAGDGRIDLNSLSGLLWRSPLRLHSADS